jgi:hypothetical protein
VRAPPPARATSQIRMLRRATPPMATPTTISTMFVD